MIVRFLRADKTGDQKIWVFQLPNAAGTVFSLWNTQQLGAKLQNTRRGEVVLLTYQGQSQDVDKIHQWTVRPYAGTPVALQQLIQTAPWLDWVPNFALMVGRYAAEERARRSERGDGAPRDEPFTGFPAP